MPSEDSDQPGHPPNLIRAFAMGSKDSRGPYVSSCGQWRLQSDWANAQADLSFRWAHRWFCWFVVLRLSLIVLREWSMYFEKKTCDHAFYVFYGCQWMHMFSKCPFYQILGCEFWENKSACLFMFIGLKMLRSQPLAPNSVYSIYMSLHRSLNRVKLTAYKKIKPVSSLYSFSSPEPEAHWCL